MGNRPNNENHGKIVLLVQFWTDKQLSKVEEKKLPEK